MKLDSIYIQGFKSISNIIGQEIPFGDITVLIGANGAGKSNLVSSIKMLNYLASGVLQGYVASNGASWLLFGGPKKTNEIIFRLKFSSKEAKDSYEVQLNFGLHDRLYISKEIISHHNSDQPEPQVYSVASGSPESLLKDDTRATSRAIYSFLSRIRTYQFHDTTDTARIKDRSYIDDVQYLWSDAGNLSAFLKMLKETSRYLDYYQRIIRCIRRVMPQFGDFELGTISVNRDSVRLNWSDNSGSGYLYDPHQISDGSLRFMALATLLMQPPDLLPNFIVIDEPELGLHPAAIAELAAMVQMASQKSQIVLATQSTRLVDEFLPKDIVVVERDESNNSSIFKVLDSEQLKEWLDQYSLSELWEKNVLGGQP